MKSVADILLRERERLGKTKSEMADLLGIASQRYTQYEPNKDPQKIPKIPSIEFAVLYKEKTGINLIDAFETKVTSPVTAAPPASHPQELKEVPDFNQLFLTVNALLKTVAEIESTQEAIRGFVIRRAAVEDKVSYERVAKEMGTEQARLIKENRTRDTPTG